MFAATQLALALVLGEPSLERPPSPAQILDAAIYSAGEIEVDKTIELLEGSIAAIVQQPQTLLDNPELVGKLAQARAMLVWAYVAAGQVAAADTAMDEAIRSSIDGVVATAGLGPEIEALYVRRLELLKAGGRGIIEVRCEMPCDILLNDRPSEPKTEVLLGTYRIFVAARGGGVQPKKGQVVLRTPGRTVGVVYMKESSVPGYVPEEAPKEKKIYTQAENRKQMRSSKIVLGVGGGFCVIGVVGAGLLPFVLDVGAVLGVAGGAVGVNLLIIGGSMHRQSINRERERLRMQASLPVPILSPQMTGVGWAMRF